MSKTDLTITEELNIEQSFREPFLDVIFPELNDRKRVAYLILSRSNDEVLLLDDASFLVDSVFAGLTQEHISYIAKNGPKNYKASLLKILQDQEMMRGVFEITRAMDTDLGENVSQNQQRVALVIQYIKDNQIAFQF